MLGSALNCRSCVRIPQLRYLDVGLYYLIIKYKDRTVGFEAASFPGLFNRTTFLPNPGTSLTFSERHPYQNLGPRKGFNC